MGKRGKPSKKGGKGGGLLGGLLGAGKQALGGGMGGGGQTGTFRVDRFGNVTRVTQKRRKKGFRMPRMMAEQIRAQNELTRSLATAVILSGVHK